MPPESATPKFILMIEDNCDHAEALTHLLELNGYRAECAPNGAQGLRRVGDISPDLVLLDFTLPDMSGAAVGKIIRSASQTAAVPIVIGSGMPELVVRESFADFDGFLAKPFDPAQVLSLVARLTGARAE